MKTFEQEVFDIHDIECNQKYDKTLPYSFHLKMVMKQFERFQHILPSTNDQIVAYYACVVHDVVEDGRRTYNDVIELVSKYNKEVAKDVAEAVYCVTDFKGRTRAERKPEQYYKELFENKIALFVKLCDMIANRYYSCMSNSSMKAKYKQEFFKFGTDCYYEPYKEMFNLLENMD